MDLNILFYFYLHALKKIIPIFLLFIICINHLDIIDAAMGFRATYKKENSQTTKNFPSNEKSETEKENKGKEKIEEQEKYFRTNHSIAAQFQLSDKDKYICFSTKLNIHPYQEDDIQPPKAV